MRLCLLLLVPVVVLLAVPEAARAKTSTVSAGAPFGLGRLGPFEITSDDGDHRLRVRFFGQLRLTYTDRDGSERPRTDQLTLQRIRPILEGRFWSDRLAFKLHLNTGPTTVELLDFFVDYAFVPGVRLRVGQAKTPLTRYRVSSVARLTLVDWSRPARFFGAERQIGALLHNGFGTQSEDGLEWALGLYSGTNARSAFEDGPSRVYGEPLPNPSDLSDPAAPADLHPELVARVGWHHGQDRFASDSDPRGGPLRLTTGVAVAWDADPVAGRDFSFRVMPEVLMKVGGVSASAQGYGGFFEKAAGGGGKVGALGANVQAAWRFVPFLEVAARYSAIRVLDAMRQDARARAAALAGAEEPPAGAGALAREDELTVGLNAYAVGHALKLQTDLAVLWRERDGAVRRDYQLRSQLQVMF